MFYFWIDGHDMRIIEADGVSLFSFNSDVSGSYKLVMLDRRPGVTYRHPGRHCRPAVFSASYCPQ